MSYQLQQFDKERAEFEEVRSNNEVMRRKLGELGEMTTRVNDYEYKIEMITKEI